MASIGHHWNEDHTPKTKEAEHGVEIVNHTLDIIKTLDPEYYYIENPRGKLRKLPPMYEVPYRSEVTYCSYGDMRMKPTDIQHNNFNWIPRTLCKNGNVKCHHESAPRGSKTGTQGLKGNYERSIVPPELCKEILESSL